MLVRLSCALFAGLAAACASTPAYEEHMLRSETGEVLAVVEGPRSGSVVSPGQPLAFRARVNVTGEPAKVLVWLVDSEPPQLNTGHEHASLNNVLEAPNYSAEVRVPPASCGTIKVALSLSLPQSKGIAAEGDTFLRTDRACSPPRSENGAPEHDEDLD
jgi:hypothetical protein